MISDKNLDNMLFKMNERRDLSEILLTRQAADEIILYLQELKQRRECELRTATKFIKSTFQEQLNHVKSEIKEIEEAENNHIGTYDYYALLDEITDAQHSLQTLKAIARVTKEDDLESHKRVTGKNIKRGYYDEK